MENHLTLNHLNHAFFNHWNPGTYNFVPLETVGPWGSPMFWASGLDEGGGYQQ